MSRADRLWDSCHAAARLLCGLAALTLCAASGCGGRNPSDADAKKATEWVLSRDGSVSIFGSDLPIRRGGKIPEADFGVRRVDLNEKGVTDADLEQLSGLGNLEYLGLYGAKITAAGIDRIAAHKSLRELELSYTRLDDEGLKKLEALPKLQKLFINGTRVTRDGAASFSKARPGCAVFHLSNEKPKAEKPDSANR